MGYNPSVKRDPTAEMLGLLSARLERLSADSRWARRASGVRGNILKILAEIESGKAVNAGRISSVTDMSFYILRQAAKEIPDLDDLEG